MFLFLDLTIFCIYLPISQQGIHAFQETGVEDIGLVHNESDLLIFAARSSQHCSQVFIKILTRVLPVNLHTMNLYNEHTE